MTPLRRIRRSLACAALLTLSALLLGCGAGTPDPGNGDGNGNGDAITPLPADIAEAVATSDTLEAQFAEAAAEGAWADAADSFITFARAQDGVAEVSLSPNGHDVGVLYDSGVFEILHHHPDEPGASSRHAAARSAIAHAAGIPASERATIGSGFVEGEGAYLTACFEAIFDAFDRASYDHTSTVDTANVAWFRSWGQYGVIHYESHGGQANFTTPSTGPASLYAVQTSETFSAATGAPAAYADDLRNRRMGFFYTSTADQRVLCLTHLFFERYCDPLQSGAIIFPGTCNALTDPAQFALPLCNLGAEVVLGWVGLAQMVAGGDAAVYFWDRACGLDHVDPATPTRRPFSVDDVFAQMLADGMTHHVYADSSVADLTFIRRPETETTTGARPIITGGWYSPPEAGVDGLLTLHGYFGARAGDVLIGSTRLSTLSWQPTQILALMPASQAGLVGDVIVRVSGIESNPLILARVEGSFTIDVQDPEGRWTGVATCDFEGRGIVHRSRDTINGDPGMYRIASLGACRVWPTDTWNLSWNIGGNWTEPNDECGTTFHSLATSGSASVGSAVAGASLILEYDVDASPPQYRLQFFTRIDADGAHSVQDCSSSETHDWGDVYTNRPGWATGSCGTDLTIPRGSVAGDGFTYEWEPITITPIATDSHPA